MDKHRVPGLSARYEKLNQKQDLLLRLNQVIPWETFRPQLAQMHEQVRKSAAGRKPTDVVVLFKMLVLQQLHNISDESLEYQVNDRLSFMQFLGFDLMSEVPDATTVWLFRKHLRDAGLVEGLFEQFEGYLITQGYAAKGGQIVDATLIPVGVQHNTKEENIQIKAGEVPMSWAEKPHRQAQKDGDARWTKKRGKSYFGYKDHIEIDAEHRLIRRYVVTDASVWDGQVLGQLLDADNAADTIWGDSAYRSVMIEAVLALMGFESAINERAYRNRPLTEAQTAQNKERSSIRARVEHVFGAWIMSMGGKLLRTVGLANAKVQLGLKNLTYNLIRFTWLETRAVKPAVIVG
jgi:transposase, IS5 family